jgi:ABC-type antimicrobial peptide transport system permease subunit
MQSGRWFEEGKYDEKGFILNETAAREFRMHTPLIGQRIRMGGDTGQVIGVVKDFYYKSMHDKIGPMIISNNKGSDAYIFIRTEPGKIPQAIAATKSVWNQFLPNEPFQYSFLDDNFNNLYKADIKTSKLVFIFSLLAIVVSALGLFGLASFLSEQRTREIGIRKVLGASVQHIAILLSREFVWLVTIAILIAAPVAWWLMNRWLDDFAYRIHINIWIVGISGTIAMLIALVSIGSQTIQAAVENPVKSLRSE